MRHSNTIMGMVITGGLLGGCVVQLPGNLDAGEDETTTGDGDGDTGDGDGDTGDGDGDGAPDPGPIDGDGCQQALDILVIIDNSGSMGEEQALMAQSMIGSLLTPVNDAIDWRLAVTTTDNGNPWCPPGTTTPEAGAFQMQACNDHLEDFLFNSGAVDVRDIACNDLCPYAPGKLHTTPTTTAEDPVPTERPWLERIGGQSNLPEDVDPLVAALCMVPQGINGCGFEQPLESMALALGRAMDPGEPEYGFLRADASLLVVIVTDEADCSHVDESIFDANGNKAFWSDPQLSFPSSAVCWNAGVECTGNPDDLDCNPADFAADGSPTTPENAVLHPVSRYTDMLGAIEQQKRAIDPGADVSVLIIGGLGTDGQLHYADVGNIDPEFQESFGIGPGCTIENGLGEMVTAVPPVRLREVGAALSSESLASICSNTYFDAFAGAYARLLGSCN